MMMKMMYDEISATTTTKHEEARGTTKRRWETKTTHTRGYAHDSHTLTRSNE